MEEAVFVSKARIQEDQTASAQRSSEASSPPSVPEGTQQPTDPIANPMGPDGAPQPTEHSAHPSEDDVAAEPQQDTPEMVDDTQQSLSLIHI